MTFQMNSDKVSGDVKVWLILDIQLAQQGNISTDNDTNLCEVQMLVSFEIKLFEKKSVKPRKFY